MPTSIAAQSHCFVDWLFINALSVRIIHVCKGLWKLPAVNDPNMQELDRSRACALQRSSSCMFGLISRKLKKNSLQKSFGFPRSLKALRLFASVWFCIIGWSCKNCPYFSELPLRLMHLSPDESILKSWPTDLFYFVMLMVRFTFAGARRIQEEKYEVEMSQLAKDSQAQSGCLQFHTRTLTYDI